MENSKEEEMITAKTPNIPIYKIKRKYNVKTPNFIEWIISCLGQVTPEMRSVLLDDYEIRCVKAGKKWAQKASVEEILVMLIRI